MSRDSFRNEVAYWEPDRYAEQRAGDAYGSNEQSSAARVEIANVEVEALSASHAFESAAQSFDDVRSSLSGCAALVDDAHAMSERCSFMSDWLDVYARHLSKIRGASAEEFEATMDEILDAE